MPRVTIHVISFRVIRSRALDLELASHSTSSARERIVDETRERSTALDMSTAEASSEGRGSNSRASSTDDDSGGVSAAFALALSVVSSVSLVIVNKHLISALGFREGARRGALVATRRDARASARKIFRVWEWIDVPTTDDDVRRRAVTLLTAMHMVLTATVLRAAARMGYFERKSVGRGEMVKFGALNSASVALLNLSLGFNSVGFYQMSKLSIIPVTVGLQMTYFDKKFSARVKLSLAVLLLGVGASTVTDVQLNATGFVIGLLSVITTSIGQILTGSLQQKLGLSSTQLLCAAAPWMALTLVILAPPVDGALNGGNILESNYSSEVMCYALMSCFLAILVNFATFAVIGKCSAVTYQVIGHLKTMLVLGFGFVVVGDPVVAKNIAGLLVALFGMILYARAEMRDRALTTASKSTADTESSAR